MAKKNTKPKTNGSSNGAAKHEPADLFDDDDAGAEGDVVERVTISSGDKSVTLTAGQLDDVAAAAGKIADAYAPFTPTRKLKCILSTDELAERASLVDTNFEQIEEAEHELDAHARRAKAKIDSLIEENREIARVRRDGYEYRDVPCVEERDDRLGCMNTIRQDTGEIIESRALSAQERQGHLFDEATA